MYKTVAITKSTVKYLYRTLFLILLLLSMSSCVMIPKPFSPSTDITYIEDITIPKDTYVTLGYRRAIETLIWGVEQYEPSIELVDGLLFRDTAFPDGGWKLKDLLTPDRCQKMQQELSVDYLILLGSFKLDKEKKELLLTPVLGGITEEVHTSMSAVIINLNDIKVINRLNIDSKGSSEVLIAAVIFRIALLGGDEYAMYRELGDEVMKKINEMKKKEKVRIAILSAEPLI